MNYIETLLDKNGLMVAFLVTGLIMYTAELISKFLFRKKIPGSAIAIFAGLVLAYMAGVATQGKNGIADLIGLSGFKEMGGPVFRDFAIVSTAMGASFAVIKKTGLVGILSLFIGVIITFSSGVLLALGFGIKDAESLATIGAGACTFVVGPVTGTAVGASSDIIAISIGAGVIKSILVTIGTPLIAKYIGLDNPKSAMVFGGLLGTTSGVAAGLAATDPKLVPYGAMTATFYTGLGCLLCPSVLYFALKAITN
jgi:malonate transporter MadM subunit